MIILSYIMHKQGGAKKRCLLTLDNREDVPIAYRIVLRKMESGECDYISQAIVTENIRESVAMRLSELFRQGFCFVNTEDIEAFESLCASLKVNLTNRHCALDNSGKYYYLT